MSFSKISFTNAGRALQAKALAGTPLVFTKIALGSGSLNGRDPATFTSLLELKVSLSISKTTREGQQVMLEANFSNQDNNTGFYWREVGLFANDPTLGEILYCYGNAGNVAEYIQPSTSSSIEKVITLTAVVGNAQNVTAIINTAAFATKKDISAMTMSLSEVNSKLAQKVNQDELLNGLTPKDGVKTWSQLQTMTTGNTIGDYYYCSDGDGINPAGNYRWTGNGWSFGGTGDQGYSVLKKDLEKLDELTVTDTILLSSDNMESGSINKDTGTEETSNNSIRTSKYIDISAITEIQFKGETSSEYYVRLVFYDTDKNYVSGAGGVLANSGTIKLSIISGVKYVRVVLAFLTISDIGYVKPILTVKKYVSAEYITGTLEEVKEKIADKTIISKINTVSFDSDNVTNGTIDKDTGVESESSTSCISNYINLGLTPVNIMATGKTANTFYVRPVFYDADKTFISSPGGLDVHKTPQSFDIPTNARYMKMVFALNATDVGYVKPHVDIYDIIPKNSEYTNDWTIKYSKWVDIPSGELLKYTDSRNACTNGFLRARKGDTITLQAPVSFSLLLFSDTDSSKCYYNSYKDSVFYSTYTFKTDCYFMLNFTNQEDKTAILSVGDIVFAENTIPDVVAIAYDKEHYDTVFVASAWSSKDEKRVADYVCDGVNDGEELQQAIWDLESRGGGVLKLSNNKYIIDTLFDSGNDEVGKFGIYLTTNNYNVSLVKIEGVNFPNVLQPMYFTHCARLDMSAELYESLSENELVNVIGVLPPIINGTPKRASVGCTVSIENVAINIPAPQKKIIGVNCEYAYNMQLKGVHCGLTEYAGDPQTPNGKIINSNIDCIGIRTLYGYNWGSGYRIDDCNVRGWGLGFDISGEHLIMQNACARFVNTGFRFGHFGDDQMMSHPNTLINCCEEWLLNGMVFEGNSLGQSVNIIDFNIEDMTSNGWGRKTLATESVKGAYKGTLTYTTTKDSYKNSQEKFWAGDGSGKNILTRDLNDKFSGTTSERPKYPQNNQQYFDTTLNKMLYYIDGNWVDAMGTIIN